MATKAKIGLTAGVIVSLASLLFGCFQFYDHKVSAGIPARVAIVEVELGKAQASIGGLQREVSSVTATQVQDSKRLDRIELKIDKISDALGVSRKKTP